RDLLAAQHDQRIGAIGHLPPLRIVVGLELPGFAALRHQQHMAVLQPPQRRREGGDRESDVETDVLRHEQALGPRAAIETKGSSRWYRASAAHGAALLPIVFNAGYRVLFRVAVFPYTTLFRSYGIYWPRSMISGSALSGTFRHCALSSASNCQVSPPCDINSIWPYSSHHSVGAKAAIANPMLKRMFCVMSRLSGLVLRSRQRVQAVGIAPPQLMGRRSFRSCSTRGTGFCFVLPCFPTRRSSDLTGFTGRAA